MLYNKDIDSTLDFNDYDSQPTMIRNAMILEDRVIPAPFCDPSDSVTAHIATERIKRDRFADQTRTKTHENYNRAAAKLLHHQEAYAPVSCVCFDEHGNKKPCEPGCSRL
jgi:hypothetical protein